MEVEICCSEIAAVREAREGGAHRIELCSGLSEGGLTPSIALIREAKAAGIEKVNVLIRPRSGDFLYTHDEIQLMGKDIAEAIENGADGIVIGVLTPEGRIDKESMNFLLSIIRQHETGKRVTVTFHRAFDLVEDPFASLEEIIEMGCDSVLTSGLSSDAYSGKRLIKELHDRAAGRIEIIAGGGVNPDNVSEIISVTEADAIHSTARTCQESKMKFRRSGVSMGSEGNDEYHRKATTAECVAKLIKNANSDNK